LGRGSHIKATKGLNLTYKCITELGLTVNSDKTTCMKFSITKPSNYGFPLVIHSCKDQFNCNMQHCIFIKQISKIRYLGIIFVNNLRRNFHIKNLVGKLRYSLYRFVKWKDILIFYIPFILNFINPLVSMTY